MRGRAQRSRNPTKAGKGRPNCRPGCGSIMGLARYVRSARHNRGIPRRDSPNEGNSTMKNPKVRIPTTIAEESWRQRWETPRWFIRQLESYGIHFVVDIAASQGNTLCDKYFSIGNSALRPGIQWLENPKPGEYFWINPPSALTPQFVEAALSQHQNFGIEGVMVTLASPSSRWACTLWEHPRVKYIPLRGRLEFNRPPEAEKTSSNSRDWVVWEISATPRLPDILNGKVRKTKK